MSIDYKIMDLFLNEHKYIDFLSPNIQKKAAGLFGGLRDETQKAKIAYEFVRDEIPHTFDIKSNIITAKASDVLKFSTGICHAKANLLAAFLRSQSIATGFCYQCLTLDDDDSMGYALHCYNAIYHNGHWIKVDARGNKPGVNAQFSLGEPVLAFQCRPEYGEYFFGGIYAAPHESTMQMLDRAESLQDVLDNIPEMITELPDIAEENIL
jgi:transglutaminase-like putative cysteine protease